MQRSFAGVPELAPVARAALGRGLTAVERIPTGSKKGVYRLVLADGGTAIAYVWSPGEDFWPAQDAPDDVFADASGLDLFEAAHKELAAVGVRTPRLLWADRSRRTYPADVAVVEDVGGETLQDRLERDPATAALGELREALAAMAAVRDPRTGKVSRPDGSGRSCPRIVLDGAARDLADAAAREPRIAAARPDLAAELAAAAAAIEPRKGNALVHGELGGDHVLLDAAGRPVLVDIEGLAFFDVEWEHAFLENRFHEAYDALRLPGLDPARLRLYRLARHLSLVAGPLRLAGTDYPDRQFMLDIAAHNATLALASVS